MDSTACYWTLTGQTTAMKETVVAMATAVCRSTLMPWPGIATASPGRWLAATATPSEPWYAPICPYLGPYPSL